jgi:hypothetical protein
VRPEARWGALIIDYIRKGFSIMTPGQQETLAMGMHELCEAVLHVTVTEPLLRELGYDPASVGMGAWPAPIEYEACTAAFLESLTVGSLLNLQGSNCLSNAVWAIQPSVGDGCR